MSARRPLWPKVPAAFVQRNLTGHKILGLAVSALLYLICLSGTLTVFYLDLQRWEAGRAPDAVFTPQGVAAALTDARAFQAKGATALTASTPTHDAPRLTVNAGAAHRGYDSQGRYAGPADTPAIDGLTALHYDLHMPVIGLTVVGLGGIAIAALLIGGLLAHPRIFKDAFLWRPRGGARLNRADLHNRVGVWASPFHLAIAVTGALIGLLQIVVLVAGLGFYKGDTTAAGAPLFGDQTVTSVQGSMGPAELATAFRTLKQGFPGAEPNYVSLNNLGTDHESLTVWADIPDRLVYGEEFEFDGKGRLVTRHHLTDGALGKQAYASLYRLHFGSFGGVWIRWAYTILGMGLTLLCTTGMDIWLLKAAQKGRPHPRLHRLWTGFVWGAPIAVAGAAALTLVWPTAFVAGFWSLLTLASIGGLVLPSVERASMIGRLILAVAIIGLLTVHAARAGIGATTWAVDAALLAMALISLASVALGRKSRG